MSFTVSIEVGISNAIVIIELGTSSSLPSDAGISRRKQHMHFCRGLCRVALPKKGKVAFQNNYKQKA
jgi:hypothetical protein